MIRHVLRAATLQRDPYLRMTLAPDGVADGALLVASVSAIGLIPALIDGIDLVDLFRFLLSQVFGWIILSGLIYLIGRRLLEGYGSFQGVMAASSLAYPILLVPLALSPFVDIRLALLIATPWFVAALWMAARIALDLDKQKALLAALGGWLAWLLLSLIFAF